MAAPPRTPHPLANKTVTLNSPDEQMNGREFKVEDWWQNVYGKSWMDSRGNLAALQYAGRAMQFPLDNQVIYGKIGAFGYLVHISELGPECAEKAS